MFKFSKVNKLSICRLYKIAIPNFWICDKVTVIFIHMNYDLNKIYTS